MHRNGYRLTSVSFSQRNSENLLCTPPEPSSTPGRATSTAKTVYLSPGHFPSRSGINRTLTRVSFSHQRSIASRPPLSAEGGGATSEDGYECECEGAIAVGWGGDEVEVAHGSCDWGRAG